MKPRLAIATLLLAPVFAYAEFTCPAGTEATCIETGDRVCAAHTKCVDRTASCFDDFACDPEMGYVCADEYEAAVRGHRDTVAKYDTLAKDNVDLRQQRLDRKNCVLNAGTLADAQQCVR